MAKRPQKNVFFPNLSTLLEEMPDNRDRKFARMLLAGFSTLGAMFRLKSPLLTFYPVSAHAEKDLFPRITQGHALISAVGLALWLCSCREAQPISYKEIAFKPIPSQAPMANGNGMGPGGMPPMNMNPVDIKVTWTLPKTWVVKDSANAMRIGSFAAPDPKLQNTGDLDPNAVDISVVQLAGDAGGLEANIRRWMGQVGIKATPDEMAEMIRLAPHFQTASHQSGMIVDLTDKLSGDMTQSKSIYGAVIQTNEYSVFVKAMGERDRVVKLKSEVHSFCKSLTISGPKA